ncbi:hypothetical protein KSS94_14200 [Pseudomonas fakonensis]|uniref:DUF1266 domain-containing protein n=1 Tax=Pseudomonas fakonensis TaxID=2842355 RepID=A0ABX8MY68_9PSED|nr:hypothetical protein [Pseudomonas fakonensis]QXH49114.1 hypothetical protein KSS94_14200 [Pseudomonas fakonensis]
MTLLEEWCAFREGRAHFDKSRFLGLFKDHGTLAELTQIYAGLSEADALTARTLHVLEAGRLTGAYLQPGSSGTDEQLADAAGRWLNELARFFDSIGEQHLAGCARHAKVLHKPLAQLEALNPIGLLDGVAMDVIGDCVQEGQNVEDELECALFEAWYGIAASYPLAWYIGQPLIDLDLDFSSWFELWRQGGAGALVGGEYWVARA